MPIPNSVITLLLMFVAFGVAKGSKDIVVKAFGYAIAALLAIWTVAFAEREPIVIATVIVAALAYLAYKLLSFRRKRAKKQQDEQRQNGTTIHIHTAGQPTNGTGRHRGP